MTQLLGITSSESMLLTCSFSHGTRRTVSDLKFILTHFLVSFVVVVVIVVDTNSIRTTS